MDSKKEEPKIKGRGNSLEEMIQTLAVIQRTMLKDMSNKLNENETVEDEKYLKLLRTNKKIINKLFSMRKKQKLKNK